MHRYLQTPYLMAELASCRPKLAPIPPLAEQLHLPSLGTSCLHILLLPRKALELLLHIGALLANNIALPGKTGIPKAGRGFRD